MFEVWVVEMIVKRVHESSLEVRHEPSLEVRHEPSLEVRHEPSLEVRGRCSGSALRGSQAAATGRAALAFAASTASSPAYYD